MNELLLQGLSELGLDVSRVLMALTMQNTANAMMMKSRMTAIRLP